MYTCTWKEKKYCVCKCGGYVGVRVNISLFGYCVRVCKFTFKCDRKIVNDGL